MKKKFGMFAGVFTPTVLTILGAIMYLRTGWMIGNAGLAGGIGIIILAHVITISTGLAVSSVVTNTRVGVGGAFAIISQSLGLEIGGQYRDSALYGAGHLDLAVRPRVHGIVAANLP